MNDVEADFFALGGHSLLAMKLAAQLSRIFERQVTPGQIMVASTVEQLSALLESNDDEQSQRLGFETLLPLRESHGPTLFCFHPASGFAWQFSVLSRYLSPQWSIMGIQSPRPDGPMQTAENLDSVCEHHLATLLSQQPHGPYYLLGYSLGGTLAQGIAARLHARGESVAFLGLLDTWPPETQNWQEKEANGLDQRCWRRSSVNAKPFWRRSRGMRQRPYLTRSKATTPMRFACSPRRTACRLQVTPRCSLLSVP